MRLIQLLIISCVLPKEGVGLDLALERVKEGLTLTFPHVRVDSPFEHGSPPQHYEGQPQPHCSLSYSSGGSYKTVWFINVGPKVFPLAWRCPSNLRIGKIGDVEGAEPPKGPYKSPFDQCKAGVKSYSKMYNIKKLFRKESSLIKAICKHR